MGEFDTHVYHERSERRSFNTMYECQCTLMSHSFLKYVPLYLFLTDHVALSIV